MRKKKAKYTGETPEQGTARMNMSVTVRSGHPAVSFLCGGKHFAAPMRTRAWNCIHTDVDATGLVFAPMGTVPSLVFAPMQIRRGPVLQSSSETEEAL